MPMVIPHGVSKQPVPNQRARWDYLHDVPVTENPYMLGSAEAVAWTCQWFQEHQDFEESVYALIQQRGREGK